MKKPLKIPNFKNEDEERDFWDNINLADYYEPEDWVPVSFPNLKPTTRPISIRMPSSLINSIKERANAVGVPYQAWIKLKLSEIIQDTPNIQGKTV
ncbi:MAG: BrnA antitoxin family protein [Taibaiella sp.]|nr:BrnA antitoxin family protein [Taibaiella sp.]